MGPPMLAEPSANLVELKRIPFVLPEAEHRVHRCKQQERDARSDLQVGVQVKSLERPRQLLVQCLGNLTLREADKERLRCNRGGR